MSCSAFKCASCTFSQSRKAFSYCFFAWKHTKTTCRNHNCSCLAELPGNFPGY